MRTTLAILGLAIVSSTAGLLVPASAQAFDLNADAFYDAEYSTNSGRTSEDEIDEWIHQPGARVGATHEGPSVGVSADYDIRRRIYEEDTFDDDTVTTGSASINWDALPERLSFHASNSRTETTIDSRGQFQPDNRQVTDTTIVGATLQVPSISNHYFQIGYDYTLSSYDETESDSERHAGTVAYVVPLSPVRRIQLNGTYTDVNYDNELSPDYTSQEGDLQYVNQGERLSVDVAVGYTTLERELQRDDVSGVTGNASFTWNVSGATTASFSYSHSISDESSYTTQGIPDLGEEFDENSGLNEVFVSDEVAATLAVTFGRNQVSVSPFYRAQDYEDIDRDEDTTGISAIWTRQLRPQLGASLFGTFSATNYDDIDREDEDFSAGLQFDWTRWRRLGITASVLYSEDSSDDTASDYEEWRTVISLSYKLIE